MEKNKKGISFEKDPDGITRYVRVDIDLYAQELKPLFQRIGMEAAKPEGWEKGMNADEFLSEAKKLLRKKFDERNQIP